MLDELWVKRARALPYFCDFSSFACAPAFVLYSWIVSSVRARRANSPLSSKSMEVYEAGDLNCLEGRKVWMISWTLVKGARWDGRESMSTDACVYCRCLRGGDGYTDWHVKDG